MIRSALFACFVPLSLTLTPAVHANDSDPIEGFNRKMFAFNMGLDRHILEPASKAYTSVTPSFARTGIRNVFDTLEQPAILANSVLQANPQASADTIARLGLNLTVGLAGTIDAASHFGIGKHNEDFGQTLGHWGVGQGIYVVLPVVGPTTPRDGLGSVVDSFADPLEWNKRTPKPGVKLAANVVNGLDQRARAQNMMDSLENTAIDPYVQVRNGYLHHREMQVQNMTSNDDVPDFE